MSLKIVTVIGARPQFIKAAMVSRLFSENDRFDEVIVHTGQHYNKEMSDIFFNELEIPEPNYNLGIGSGNHGAQTGRMLEAMENILIREKPRWVIVYGDTNSTLAGALAAAKLHIPIAHVEAGLRSHNRMMPEEINRVLTDHMSEILFAPTLKACQNLQAEGIPDNKINLVGDIMYDASLYYGKKSEQKYDILKGLGIVPKNYMLVTLHRAENTNNRKYLEKTVRSLLNLANVINLVFPIHPRTETKLESIGLLELMKKSIKIIKPVGYLEMTILEKNAKAIITDSGGVQKEAYFYCVPCFTMREETEWVELVEIGVNFLVGSDCRFLEKKLDNLMDSEFSGFSSQLYGCGNTSKLVRDALL